jgi:poly-gamma-glutamate system protein
MGTYSFIKRNIPKEGSEKDEKSILILFFLSLLFFILAKFVPSSASAPVVEEMIKASSLMADAEFALKECRKEKAIVIDKDRDPNQTGLIGLEFSPITTSIGNLEAKRTTTNPNFAGLLVLLLREAGVKEGDTVAVGASSSFPALVVAALSAARAMDLKPLLISSLGASQWGANNPDFHWLQIQECLFKARIFNAELIALSLGGEKDVGQDMSAEGRALLSKEIEKSGILFLLQPDLRKNVEARMRLYQEKAGEKRIKAFINIGGSWSSMGVDSEILKLKPGLAKIKRFPAVERRGVIYEMAEHKIPVIHLLYIRGLSQRYGLPWDPLPLPPPGQGKIYDIVREKQPLFIFLASLYFLLMMFFLLWRELSGHKKAIP